MKLEAVPFYGVLVGLVLSGAWFLLRYELVRFKDPVAKQYCAPSISEGTQRLGRDVTWLDDNPFQVGDLVRFRTARSQVDTTSRVLAVAGQRVQVEVGGKTLIDGVEVKDPWARRLGASDWTPEVLVPDGCVYVVNDQRWVQGSERMDSRHFGPIPVRCVDWVFAPKDDGKGGE